MSGTTTAPPYAAFSNATLSDQEKVDVREFCGYPSYGDGTVVFPAPWINVYYLALETRMNTMQASEYQRVRQFLSLLYPLDSGITAAAGNLGTQQAAVWTRNPTEIRDRTRLFNQYRRRLCKFMGVPPGPELGEGGASVPIIV
jgi:hypothetical protein